MSDKRSHLPREQTLDEMSRDELVEYVEELEDGYLEAKIDVIGMQSKVTAMSNSTGQ